MTAGLTALRLVLAVAAVLFPAVLFAALAVAAGLAAARAGRPPARTFCGVHRFFFGLAVLPQARFGLRDSVT